MSDGKDLSAQWLPWIYNEAARRYEAEGKRFPEDAFQAYKIFVTCQTDDDLPWILKYAGEHSLVIGTDYGHQDMSVELDALRTLGKRGDLDSVVAQQIVDDNPRALYAL